MIVCLDGAYGVGKTTVAKVVKKKLFWKNVEILDSDYYYMSWIKESPLQFVFGGTAPQFNANFISKYLKLIEEKAIDSGRIIISVMSLSDDACVNGLLYALQDKGYDVKHIILTASLDVLKQRVDNRPKDEKIFAISNIELQLHYFDKEFKDAFRINTEEKSVEVIANEIIQIILGG
ncbi:MAG: zeta toxin family protein [Clostridiales bacterium]|nr:zeta toxin family protein [Clostridiales bacterium]